MNLLSKVELKLEPLPYGEGDLEPYISAKTISFHYGKHHKAYIDKANAALKGTVFESLTIEEIMNRTSGVYTEANIFNNVAQAYNHDFFWKCMKHGGGGEPSGKLAEMIKTSFGGHQEFHTQFSHAAASLFGSGWVWLVRDGDKLRIIKTSNAENPVPMGLKPLLTLDVWEHAYYLDYQNRRPDFIMAFLDYLVNWDFVAENL